MGGVSEGVSEVIVEKAVARHVVECQRLRKEADIEYALAKQSSLREPKQTSPEYGAYNFHREEETG